MGMEYEAGVNKGFLAYERLEKQRLKKLGLNESFSRYYLTNLASSPRNNSPPTRGSSFGSVSSSHDLQPGFVSSIPNNSLAPFATCQKPTCGACFSDKTDNRRKQIGVTPINVEKARYKFPNVFHMSE